MYTVCCKWVREDSDTGDEYYEFEEFSCEAAAECAECDYIVDDEYCDETSTSTTTCQCDDEWDPVCCDGETYSNNCEMGCHCEIDYFTSGECDSSTDCECKDSDDSGIILLYISHIYWNNYMYIYIYIQYVHIVHGTVQLMMEK